MKNIISNIEIKLNALIDKNEEIFIISCMLPILSSIPISIIISSL